MTLRCTRIASHTCWALLLVLLLVPGASACKPEGGEAAPKDRPADPVTPLDGVWPDRFKCDSIATPEALSQVIGGTARQIDNPASVERGLAHPCVYEVSSGAVTDAGAPVFAYWTFDFDCRVNYKKTADALFAQYTRQNADLVAHYDQMSDAGAIQPNDAGIAAVRPGESNEVAVGAKALDHHGQAVLFIDDDAPCYVRVTGPDAARRLEVAKLIAKNLTVQNAPMTPRARQ